MAKGIANYIPPKVVPNPNYPLVSPTPPSLKSTPIEAPSSPPPGQQIPNYFIEQASSISARFSNMKIGYFKLDLLNTKPNLYGESINKWYYPPVEVRCLIERGNYSNSDTEYGVDVNQTITITLPITNLKDLNFTPEVGDIVTDQERYYEVNNINKQFITLPGTGISESVLGTPGQVILFVVSAYLTRVSKLNIIKYN